MLRPFPSTTVRILTFLASAVVVWAQAGGNTRPTTPTAPVTPTQPIAPGGGGGGAAVLPGTGGAVTTGPRIVTDTSILVGDITAATAALVTQGTNGAQVATGGSTYQWAITGGRILGSTTAQAIQFVADAAGTLNLSVAITNSGATQSTSVQVTAISAAAAGTITADPAVKTGATGLTASVPAAQAGDRTFRWTITGGTITGGATADTVTYRAGPAGLLELTCAVTLQRLVTVTLRCFVVVTGDGAPVVVTVNNGAGGGTYPAGSKVDLFAPPPPAGQVFDRWTGDTAALGTAALLPLLSHVVLTVPTTPVTLTATYKAAPTWTPTTVTNFNPVTTTGANNTTTTTSTTLAYHVPANRQGVVVLLHGAASSLQFWFNQPEPALLTRDLVAAGYGVVALNSINRNAGTWNAQTTLEANADATNVAAALDKLTKDGAITATTPVFLLGFAGGGDAAIRFGDLLDDGAAARPIRGAILYCAAGTGSSAVTARVPQYFALASNDDTLGTAGTTTARDNSQLLAGRGISNSLFINNPSPVHPGRFKVLAVNTPAFSDADAQAVWTAVKTAGFIDASNYYPKSAPATEAVRTALPAAYQARAAEVAAQLGVAYTGQEFYSDANARVLAFLAARVANAPSPAPGRLINLSTRTKITFIGDTFSLGFNIAGTEKATLLIRGIGPALLKFGLPTALLSPRLEVYKGSTVIASNEGWDKAANRTQLADAFRTVGAFDLTAGEGDAAVLLTLDPGSYTVTMRGLNGAIGDVLAEVYDVSRNGTRLTNLSTLSQVTEEGGSVTAGIVVAGNNPRTLVTRAVAAGLTDFGLPSDVLLGDPRISILNADGSTFATNNNWAQGTTANQAATLTSVFPAVGAFALKAPADAALVAALSPGNFSIQAAAAPTGGGGVGGAAATPNPTGTVLVEIYEVP